MNHQKNPLVTIITATYNLIDNKRAEYIKQTIQSVAKQTYQNIEHIIIDGASTDGTLELLKPFETTGQITTFREKDNGIYDAMNKGIQKAHGKYIAFLNSDDFYTSNDSVALSVRALEQKGADFCFGALNVIKKERVKKTKSYFYKILTKNSLNHPTIFCKTNVLKKEGAFDNHLKISADYKCILNLVLKNYQHVKINHIITSFRLSGISATDKETAQKELIYIWQELYHISKDDAVKIMKCRFIKWNLIQTVLRHLNLQQKCGFYVQNLIAMFKLPKRYLRNRK